MKLTKMLVVLMVVVGALITINAFASLLFSVPMFYEYLSDLVALYYINQSTNEYYLKIVPVEPSIIDYRLLWLLAGIGLVLVGRFFLSPTK